MKKDRIARRQFLKTAAVTTASTVLGAAISGAEPLGAAQSGSDLPQIGRSEGFPWRPVVVNNTPQAFGEALTLIKDINDRRSVPKIFILECFNEWTEGSYLEPDTVYGMRYLEAVKEVFGV